MRHHPVQTERRVILQTITSLPLHFQLRSPKKGGAVRREVGSGTNVPRLQGAESASSLELECGPPLGAPRPGRFEAVFRRFAPHSAVGPRRCNLFRTLRHPLARWGSSMQLPHFRLPPALAGLRLLLRSYLRSPATRHRLSQAPHSRSASGSLLKERSLREQGDVILLLMDLSRPCLWPSFESLGDATPTWRISCPGS